MKKLLILLLSVYFVSCSKNEDIINFTTEYDVENPYQLRTLSSNYPSTSNPRLHDDWQNIDTIYLNNGRGYTFSPWADINFSIDIPNNYRNDIKKEDGWKMLCHTLLDQKSTEPDYIILYNEKTGILKGFYYNPFGVPNNGFLWVVESSLPTTLFHSNKLVQDQVGTGFYYLSTSNIINSSVTNFGQLNAQNWNAFSFELAYPIAEGIPIVKIRGMNGVVSTSYGSGDYSGEVIIPIPKEDKSGLNSVMSFLESAVKLVSPTAGKAISYMGMLFGETSLYKSKSSITNIRAKSSGTIELEAKSFFDLNGYTVFSAELNLKELNGNKDMGLWTLSKNPVFTYDKYSNLNQESLDASGRYVFRGQLNTTYDIDVIISPHIKPLIKSYSIESIQFFYESEYKTPNMKFITEKISDNYDRYTTNLQFLKYGNYVNTTDFTRLLCIYSNNIPALSKLCVNITVKFNYTDGSEFISNRNFRPDFIEKDNSTTIQKLQNMGATIIWR